LLHHSCPVLRIHPIWYGYGSGSCFSLPGLNQKAFFVKFSLPVDFVILISLRIQILEHSGMDPGPGSGKMILILTDRDPQHCSFPQVHLFPQSGPWIMSWHPVLSVLFRLTCPGWPVWPICPYWPVWAVLSYVIADVISKMSCPILLSLLSYHCCPSHFPVPAALSFCHVLAILSSLSCPACTIQLFAPAVLDTCSRCPIL
jgi:hypothetical protein